MESVAKTGGPELATGGICNKKPAAGLWEPDLRNVLKSAASEDKLKYFQELYVRSIRQEQLLSVNCLNAIEYQ